MRVSGGGLKNEQFHYDTQLKYARFYLNIVYNYIRDSGCQMLCDYLSTNSSLETLDLGTMLLYNSSTKFHRRYRRWSTSKDY